MLLVGAVVWRLEIFKGAGVEPSYVAAAHTPQEGAPRGADYEQEMLLLGLATSSDPRAVSDEDPLGMIGPVVVAQLVGKYAGLVEKGAYSEEAGASAAESIAQNVRAAISYKTHAISSFKTDSDISYARMLSYRSDLREALEPLLENTQSEFEIYAAYVETNDAEHLEKLRTVAQSYRKAAENAASIRIPRDAVNYHRDILNAMEQFAATLEAMSTHADDALASVALLRSYNAAEQNMFMSFDALSEYYDQKKL